MVSKRIARAFYVVRYVELCWESICNKKNNNEEM